MRERAVKNIEDEFLKPAFQYLVMNGLENTSVRDLCKVMNLSYGSINYWFSGKDDIYISVMYYGICNVQKRLYDSLYEKICDPELSVKSFMDDIESSTKELRLISQVAASPIYGERIKEKSMELKSTYASYAANIAEQYNCTVEEIAPLLYLLISIITDYVVWSDLDATKLQLRFILNYVDEMTSQKKSG